MTPALERLLTTVIEGLILAIPLLVALLRMYVNEKRAHANTQGQLDEASMEADILEEGIAHALMTPPLDEVAAIEHSKSVRATAKYVAKGERHGYGQEE